jgi:23S rRNA pseudouridine2605 synthase
MRLNAFLAKAGVASRRGADELIKAGRVSINGKTGQLYDAVADNDIVKLDNQQIQLRKSRYILLYKPAGYVTTLSDPQGRPKVTDLIDIPERIVPIGRLDYDTTGLLLMTNDGQLAHKLMHPSFKIDKVYEADVSGEITQAILDKLSTGIKLVDGLTAPAKARKLSSHKIQLTVHEGRKHQVKRMLAAVGLPVKKLHRSGYAGLNLKGLKPGQWRELGDQELQKLK